MLININRIHFRLFFIFFLFSLSRTHKAPAINSLVFHLITKMLRLTANTTEKMNCRTWTVGKKAIYAFKYLGYSVG